MRIVGIDPGTSDSAAAVPSGGRPVIIPSAEGTTLGGKAFPSYVALTAAGQLLVGEPARRQAAANPEGTATAFKRRMGGGRRSGCGTGSSPRSSSPGSCSRRSSGTPRRSWESRSRGRW